MPEVSNDKWDSDGAPLKKKSRTDAGTSNSTSADNAATADTAGACGTSIISEPLNNTIAAVPVSSASGSGSNHETIDSSNDSGNDPGSTSASTLASIGKENAENPPQSLPSDIHNHSENAHDNDNDIDEEEEEEENRTSYFFQYDSDNDSYDSGQDGNYCPNTPTDEDYRYNDMYNDDDEEDDDDDEEDDSSMCDCHDCIQRRTGIFGMILGHAEGRGYDDDDEDDDEEEEDDDTDSQEDDSENEDDNDGNDKQCCAICFLNPKRQNPFISLPCCEPSTSSSTSTSASASTSTTRFCRKCITQTLRSQDEWNSQFSLYSVGECPRCRGVLSVDHSDGSVCIASFSQTIRHARYKGPGDGMRDALVTVAYSNPGFLPMELLRGEEDVVRQMVSWGILKRRKAGGSGTVSGARPSRSSMMKAISWFSWLWSWQWRGKRKTDTGAGAVYMMDAEDQQTLRTYIERCVLNHEDNMHGLLMSASDLCVAGIQTVFHFKLWTAARLFNQAWSNCHIYMFQVPVVESVWQEGVMMGLNLFLALMVLQVGLFVLVYGGICYAVIKIAGWLLGQPKRVRGFVDYCSRVGLTRALLVGEDGKFKHSFLQCVLYAGIPAVCGIFAVRSSYFNFGNVSWFGRGSYNISENNDSFQNAIFG